MPLFPTAFLIAITLVALLALAKPSPAQELAHRLILKDGSYQLVTKYETKGDRVRYYSSEREDWEELPTSLVDWPATEKFGKDRTSNTSVPEAVQLDKEVAEEAEHEQAKLPEVAPGLHLPEDSGVFLFDSFQGEPQLDEIQQNAADVNHSTKGALLRQAIPMAGLKQNIEIEGAHASVQAHVAVPSLYVNEEGDPDHPAATNSTSSKSDAKSASTPEGPEQPQQPEKAVVPFDRFIIVHAEVKNGHRVVGEVKHAAAGGNVAQQQHAVKTTIDRVSGGWLKITPTEPLASGEYALVETVGSEGMNLYVWDFGVNPKAPANANPWKPEAASSPAKPAKPAEPPAPTH